ncbi:uncharacterized protein A1O9_11058 [Exophiala aquamarina CBS 119918]|uniref:Endopolyphosphatase n=1 Tax=Exophiala aquamarina CBS 119918 TaxID=1182545 RepID=A0A072NYI1_9EURO|nr:uncharacterized protein A1O9_11058 [Exophiala aquamarina CBS 119918]KEF52641.1 hypothetical protein A1O9_11058 [Exophiala aquamarina CBS 119918]
MIGAAGGLLLLLLAAVTAAVPREPPSQGADAQHPLSPSILKTQPPARKLQGRFLHITDIHPDPFYKVHSSPEEQCHSGKGSSGHYGAPVTSCDAPFSLVNATFKWIEENLRDSIDFVIWTGDSARHDNDDRFPRTNKQVLKLNKFVVHKFVEAFGKPDNLHDPDPTNDFVVPIVPTFGNNDILPHNIFQPGPNSWTREYEDIWNKFIPQEQRHSFARGGWYFTEVIPNKLAVFSLNTLYFFDSNSAVDGCDLKSEPGYEHFEWLRIQLQFLRSRGMKAMLIGHVPPARTANKQNWDETCHQKFTLWLRQYRDVIVASVFGHMNIDHFMFQDVHELKYKFKIKGIDDEFQRLGGGLELMSNNETFSATGKSQYLTDLRSNWENLPKPPAGSSYLEEGGADYEAEKKHKKKKKKNDVEKFLKAIGGCWGERYSMSLVSPSVVPNFYPTLRIVHYNISGLEDHSPASKAIGIPAPESYDPLVTDSSDHENSFKGFGDDGDMLQDQTRKKKKKKKGKKKKGPQFPVPKAPSKTSPPGPGYSPQTLSLMSWRQYYANLTAINEAVQSDTTKNPHKHFNYISEYTTNNDSNYQMVDLTLRNWLDVAEKISRGHFPKQQEQVEEDNQNREQDIALLKKGKKKEDRATKARNRLWHVFVKRAFVHTKPDEEIDNKFDSDK